MRFKALPLILILACSLTAGAAHSGAQAHRSSYCGETTLASGMVTNSTPVTIVENTCTSTVFARIVDPWWFSNANVCLEDPHVRQGAMQCYWWSSNDQMTWLPFGGTLESPSVPYQSGTHYSANGDQNNNVTYIGVTVP